MSRPGRRTAAILAILLLLVVAGSDFLSAGLWLSHPMLTAIVSALVVVVLTVAVIEVVLDGVGFNKHVALVARVVEQQCCRRCSKAFRASLSWTW